MSDAIPAVTQGHFSEFKTVKTRGVAQFVIEVPLEVADRALEVLGGLPRPGKEVWVAIARLMPDEDAPPERVAKPLSRRPEAEEDPTKVIARVTIRCKEPAFQVWILGTDPPGSELQTREAMTLAAVRERLRILSRKNLLEPEPYARWQALMLEYEDHQRFGP